MECELIPECSLSPFLIIGFTDNSPWPNVEEEARRIERLLDMIDFVHIRKKEASTDYTRRLIDLIPEKYRRKLVLHSHYVLASEFNLYGVHNVISESCHALSELEYSRAEDYTFLSPIYDSISKEGYKSGFDIGNEEFLQAVAKKKVIALGGVTPSNFSDLFAAKFAGAALLGYLWSPKLTFGEKLESIKNARYKLYRNIKS